MEEPIINVYVACPMHVSLNFLEEVCKLIRGFGGTPYYWDRKSPIYDPAIMDKADIVVAITNADNYWRLNNRSIPRGTRSEIDKALQFQKPLFTTYTPSHGLQIYKVAREGNKDNDSICGIGGSSGDLRDLILKMKEDIMDKMSGVVKIKERYKQIMDSEGNVRTVKVKEPELNPTDGIKEEKKSLDRESEYSYLTAEEESKLLLITIK